MFNINSSSSGKGLDKIKEDFKKLMELDVLVGIPEDKTLRKDNEAINNAQLLYIHSNPSALSKLPARPVLEPSIKAHQDRIQQELSKAATFALEGNIREAKKQLKIAGRLSANFAQDWFTDPRNGWAPNSPLTTIRKLAKQAQGRGEAGKVARDILKYYESTGTLEGITGLEGMVRPLIDTDQMRKSITFVVREKGKSNEEGTTE